METTKTRTRWTIEEMMCLYTLIQERNGKGLDDFLESHPHRTREAARKRYNLIKSGKINVNELDTNKTDGNTFTSHTTVNATLPDMSEKKLFNIEDYEPFRPNVFVKFWRFIKRIFEHDE